MSGTQKVGLFGFLCFVGAIALIALIPTLGLPPALQMVSVPLFLLGILSGVVYQDAQRHGRR